MSDVHAAAPPKAASPPHRRRLTMPLRVIRARPRLLISIVVGLAVVSVLPARWLISTRLLVGWDAGVCLYLLLVYRLMARTEATHIRSRALSQDEGRRTMLVLTVLAALASLAAIFGELGSMHTADGQTAARMPIQLALATATIALSWGFIHTIFALHYAHDYYDYHGDKRCLSFPGNEAPDYWDFVYFSFVVGMTSQVSDVAVTSRGMRRTVTAHGILSFFFNVALLALTVNIAASAI
jgi:uncharacterized membrane protein